ncbi:MAG: LysR substrate-binding domain-containing protein [Arenibacterium sp.]
MLEFENREIRRLDGTLLLIFLGLMRHRKAATVAEEMSITPSTVSHALGRLRDIFRDDLFLRRPHGLEPTAIAIALEPTIRDALETLRLSLSRPQYFDPAKSTSVVRLSAYDVDLVTIVPRLINRLIEAAPQMRLISIAKGRQDALDELSHGNLDLAIGLFPDLQQEVVHRGLFIQEYAVVSRPGVISGRACSLDAYISAKHVVVSPAGELRGVVDESLAQNGKTRDVVLSVPLFFPSLVAVTKAPLIATVPKSFALEFAGNFGLEVREPPLPIRSFEVSSLRHIRNKNNAMLNWVEDQIAEGLQSDHD